MRASPRSRPSTASAIATATTEAVAEPARLAAAPDARGPAAGGNEGAVGAGRARRRAFSPLLRRILLVNVLPLAILVGGLLYLDQYRSSLIAAEVESLRSQAELIAAALGEGAVRDAAGEEHRLMPSLARQMVRRLGRLTDARARLFADDGALIADSRGLERLGGFVQIEVLPPPRAGFDWRGPLERGSRALGEWFARGEDRPLYHERAEQRAEDYAEAVTALGGDTGQAVRIDSSGGLVITATAPVQRFKKVLGAVMLSESGEDLEQTLFTVRLAILNAFGVALVATVLLSVYLARTIARPLLRLASAAETVRRGEKRAALIPDLSARGDEIGDLSAALRDMTEALWRRLDAIERFAADVAHEIKNPLTSLQSAVETASRLSDPAGVRGLMKIIVEDVQRINRLVSDISDASRLDAELSRVKMTPVDLGRVLAALGEVHVATKRPGDPRLVVVCEDGRRPETAGLVVNGIDIRLVQVFRNLIANAVSFSPPGGTITVRLAGRDGWIEAAVEDEGPGVPEGKLEAIFDRFYSERPAAEKFGTHSGLGLSISRQIVDAHGGTIRAENRRPPGGRPGRAAGARLIVRLPRADAGR
ncbi:MAG: sensor histidine kinase [Proteobacteria bacterium]|nr:sensor histidine kinase [Pseudomonadota bacterium]